MIIDCISDLHGHFPDLLGGDILLLGGDYTASNKINEWIEFFEWLDKQKYKHKIIISGNHDSILQENYNDEKYTLLYDDYIIINKLKIYGTPWTPWFSGVHPHCKNFMDSEKYLESRFKKIPHNIDILLSHSPPFQILDRNIKGNHCGSTALRNAIDVIKPKYHIFGHIHEQGSKQLTLNNTHFINCAHMTEFYEPVYKEIRIEIP